MNQESTDPPSLLHNQFVDVGIFDYGIECTHRPPSRMVFLGHRTLEDDNRLGYREQAWGLRTIVDLTADPAKHFVACQRTDSDLVVARPRSSNEMLCSNGVKFCWIGLRNTAYAKKVLHRISWWNHCKLVWRFVSWDMENPTARKIVEDAIISCDPIVDCRDILDCAAKEIGQSVSNFSHAAAYPICLTEARDLKLQCLVLTIVLLAADKPESVVQKCICGSLDALSGSPESDERERAVVSDLLNIRHTWVEFINSHLETHHQGVSSYLLEGGVTAEQRGRLATILREIEKEDKSQDLV